MKKHILTILVMGFVFAAMFASVQTVYADDEAGSEPEGCIAFTSDQAFTVSLGDSGNGNTWDGIVEYSVPGADWQPYTAGTSIDSVPGDSGQYSVFFRGEGNSYLSTSDKHTSQISTFGLSESDSISCSGNIENLLNYTDVERGEHPEMGDYAYAWLFKSCKSLTEAPNLPATTMAECCYSSMFEGCTGLTKAPELPAETMAVWCYGNMFSRCTGLNDAPKLSGRTLADCCYYGMFKGCTSLTEAPNLPATTMAECCYSFMFSGCTGLNDAPKLPAMTLDRDCYAQMFEGCANLTKAPELPATTLGNGCYSSMFKGCTGLKTAPALPATTLGNGCYSSMFSGCTGLETAPELPATTLAMVCYSNMFESCTSLNAAPALPATTLAEGCYYSMFEGCSGLTEAPELPAQTLANNSYDSMFWSCTSLVIPPALPATTLAKSCYNKMFRESGVRLSIEMGIVDNVFYGIPYRIPEAGNGTGADYALNGMFLDTGGPFRGTPDLNTTYYLAVPGSGTEEDPYVISDVTVWNALADIVESGYSTEGLYFKLGKDIEVTSMVGVNGKPFSGNFDGAGYTLTFNPEGASLGCAPFAYTKDAVFRDLHIAGTIKTDEKYAAGLIGFSEGTTKMINCRSSVIIDSSVDGDGSHGGFIAKIEINGSAEFEGCVFDGKLLGPETTCCGGFIGWASGTDKTDTVTNCLFAPEELTIDSESFNFIRNAPAKTTIQNSYYTENIYDNSQGKAARTVTADEGITVGSEMMKEYSVSRITAHETGLVCGNVFYAGGYYDAEKEWIPDQVPVTIPSACDGITANAGMLDRDGTTFTLTMPDENVTLTLNKGANHKWKDATCTEPKTCTVCSATEGAALGHKWKDATCTEPKICSVCSATEGEALGHKWKDASCTEPKTCSVCNATEGEALGHKWKDASCTEPKTCSVCNATEGAALGHKWGTWASLDENQHQRVCGYDSTHTETADHEWDEGVVTKEATTEETGEMTFTCGVCGATRIEVIPVDDPPVDPDIPVIDTAELKTVGNFARKEMKIFFHTDAAVTNYRIQYRMAGETEWKSGWTDGADTYTFRDMKKGSLCEFRIAGFVELADSSWVRGEWSDISYRYMKAVKVKSAKAGKGRLTVRWKKDRKATGYQIKYFTDKKIHMADADTIPVNGKAKTKYTIRKLQKGTYYVRVRPIKVVDGKEYLGILKNTKKAKVK